DRDHDSDDRATRPIPRLGMTMVGFRIHELIPLLAVGGAKQQAEGLAAACALWRFQRTRLEKPSTNSGRPFVLAGTG
ncbi:MAG: hypothetical protein MK097_21815, partial [Dechloromonas sp.]|nr:hypothetical protein [Dechloromonas sp.]